MYKLEKRDTKIYDKCYELFNIANKGTDVTYTNMQKIKFNQNFALKSLEFFLSNT